MELNKLKKHINLKDRNVLWIDELVVDEKNRGNGTGKVLFKEVMKIAKIKKCNFVELNCWNFNENAIKFYEKCEMKTQRNIMEMMLSVTSPFIYRKMNWFACWVSVEVEKRPSLMLFQACWLPSRDVSCWMGRISQEKRDMSATCCKRICCCPIGP